MMSLRRLQLRNGRGFTLIEAALTTTIIGVGFVAMLGLLAAGTASNGDGAELTTGLNLARNVREMSLGLAFTDPTTPNTWGLDSGESISAGTFDDLNDLDNAQFTTPINACRQPLSSMTGWSQSVRVTKVDVDYLASTSPQSSSNALRLTATVTHNGREVCSMSWYAFKATP